MIFHPDALAEFEAAIAYHEEAREGYGERLRAAVLAEVDRAERFPDIGHEVEGFAKRHDVRRLVVELFQYIVVFAWIRGVHTVVAVAHTRRDPEYWHGRVR